MPHCSSCVLTNVRQANENTIGSHCSAENALSAQKMRKKLRTLISQYISGCYNFFKSSNYYFGIFSGGVRLFEKFGLFRISRPPKYVGIEWGIAGSTPVNPRIALSDNHAKHAEDLWSCRYVDGMCVSRCISVTM